MSREKLLKLLPEVLYIPQIERLIYHKIEELGFYWKDEVDHYRKIKAELKRGVPGNLAIWENEKYNEQGNKYIYHFELYQEEDGHWITSNLYPEPPEGFEANDILPEEIVTYIGTFNTETGNLESKKGLTIPGREEQVFDFRFVKYYSNHILGVVEFNHIPGPINSAASPKPAEENDKTDPVADLFANFKPSEGDLDNYKELFYYMQKYPSLKNYFFTEFNVKIKPLVMAKGAKFNDEPFDD